MTNGSCRCQNKGNELVGQQENETNSEFNDEIGSDNNGNEQVEEQQTHQYMKWEVTKVLVSFFSQSVTESRSTSNL